ncbi:MAG: hypothetical protein WC603_03110 [Candidatus Paceibacterota bacterium]|jgi:hypothetical protein
MKNIILLFIITVVLANTAFGQPLHYQSTQKIYAINKSGDSCFIFKVFPGDITIKIPVDSCAEYIPYTWNNGQQSENGIAVSVQLGCNIEIQRYFIPFLLTKDTLYTVINSTIKNKIFLNSLFFKDSLSNPARIEIWYEDNLIGDLPPDDLKSTEGGLFFDCIELFSIVTGFDTLSGDPEINNRILCEKIRNIFEPNGPDKFTSKFPFMGNQKWGRLY